MLPAPGDSPSAPGAGTCVRRVSGARIHRKRGEEEPVVRGVCTRRRIGPDHRGLGDHETRGLRTRQIAPGGGVQQR